MPNEFSNKESTFHLDDETINKVRQLIDETVAKLRKELSNYYSTNCQDVKREESEQEEKRSTIVTRGESDDWDDDDDEPDMRITTSTKKNSDGSVTKSVTINRQFPSSTIVLAPGAKLSMNSITNVDMSTHETVENHKTTNVDTTITANLGDSAINGINRLGNLVDKMFR